MKHLTFVVSLALLVVAVESKAQQNLFNIPSGDITPKSKLFYQHQINSYSLKDYESKSHLVFGLGKGWDMGVNLVDMPIRFLEDSSLVGLNDVNTRTPLYPFLMATLQKQFKLNEKLLLNVGTQAGPNVTNRLNRLSVAHFTYSTLKWYASPKAHIVVGPYVTNGIYVGGPSNSAGWMCGYEIEVTDDFMLMGDFVSGDHKKSVSTFGFVYDVGKRAQVCVAALLPFPNRELSRGVVFELNLFSWDWEDHHDDD